MPELARLRADGKLSAVKNSLEACPLVILDDIATRDLTGPQMDAMLYLLNIRCKRPLIVTCNFSPAALSSIMDDRIVSRVSAGVVIEVTGEDRRVSQSVEIKA